jgi:thiamine biosynthesis lipoprotein
MDRNRVREAVLTPAAAGVAAAAQPHRYVFRAMGGEHELQLWASSRRSADRAADAAIADVLRIEAKYSRYRDDSVTAAINRCAGRGPVAIDPETAALLRYADRCHALSGGRFDLTSGVLRHVWRFGRRPPSIPADADIDAARARIGWTRVEWDDARIRLPDAGMELDFGGIGKEYAADRAAAICAEHGIEHGLVNLGGDVRVIGARVDGMPWRVGIRHPRIANAVIGTVDVLAGAVATSGDYQRYFEIGGRRYCHLLDALTGRPVDGWQSASVVAPLAIVAGSYATIAMLLGEDAQPFLDAQRVGYRLVRADGSVVGSATVE